jgi:hypothetical protein
LQDLQADYEGRRREAEEGTGKKRNRKGGRGKN